ELQVIGEIEPGARVIEKVALPEPTSFDPPDKLDAVRWGAASTADVKNIQAPFLQAVSNHLEAEELLQEVSYTTNLAGHVSAALKIAPKVRFVANQSDRNRPPPKRPGECLATFSYPP